MALIPFPPGVPVTRSDLALAHPGQIVLRSPYGGGTQVLGRGPGIWSGRLEIGPADRASVADRRAVEAFLARLRGAGNTFEAPLHRPSGGSLVAGAELSVQAAGIYAGGLRVWADGSSEGLVAGDYVRIGERLYQLVSDLRGGRCELEPPATPSAGRGIAWEGVTCLARRTGPEREPWRLDPDFAGPWAIEWEEAA